MKTRFRVGDSPILKDEKLWIWPLSNPRRWAAQSPPPSRRVALIWAKPHCPLFKDIADIERMQYLQNPYCCCCCYSRTLCGMGTIQV